VAGQAALRLPSGTADSESVAENTHGAVTADSVSSSGVAIPSLVKLSAGASGHSGKVGEVSDGTLPQSNNGREQGDITTGEHPYGLAVLSAVTDERHRHGAAFLVEVYRQAQARQAFRLWWLSGLTQSTCWKGLHGYRLLQGYCVGNSDEPSNMAMFPNAVLVVSDYIARLQVVEGLFEVAKRESLQALQDS
jgi:hypothetical protein